MPSRLSLLLVVQICLSVNRCYFAHAFLSSVRNPALRRTHNESGSEVGSNHEPISLSPRRLSASPQDSQPNYPEGGDETDLLQSPEGESTPGGGDATGTSKEDFVGLVEEVMKSSKSEHIPRLLANNIEVIIGLQGQDGAQIITSILEDAKADGEKDGDDSVYTQTLQTIDMILGFAEDFVRQAQEMDAANKQLLGKIIKAMVTSENDQSVAGGEGRIISKEDSASKREQLLDTIMKEEKKNFSSGFLRHIDGECDRISNQEKLTPESTRLLDILRMIQTRVLEELGQDLGEAALVLGQLMGYEKEEELLGVLEAGLTVRGNEFALEMASLTEEALDGFSRVPGGADPELVDKVRFIDRRVQEFLNETNEFQ